MMRDIIENDVIILAGGLGERLRHVVSDTQKVMAPVCGQPFLSYIVNGLTQSGVRRIVLAVSYKAEQIKSFFGSVYHGAQIVYSEEKTPLGTGGAIKQAMSFCETDDVFIFNGDTYFSADTAALAALHEKSGAELTIAVKKMYDFSRYGTVCFDGDGRVCAFNEKKPVSEGYINGGVYLIKKSIADRLPDGKFSFESDILEPLAADIRCVPSDGYFIDIGIPQDYFRAQTEIPLLFGQNVFKAAFLDRDGVICREKHHLYKTEDFEFVDGVPRAMAKLREQGYLIVVITNQAGIGKGLYTEDDLEVLHEYMKKQLKDSAFIDAIYYCPYHPCAVLECYRADSRDRKPAPGMIERAVADFAEKGINIDLSCSVIVGDTERDIETGINAGIGLKVLVRSGHAIPDESLSKADIIVDSLSDCALMSELRLP